MIDKPTSLAWPVLGILAAGLMFSSSNPELTDQIGSAVIRGLIVVGAIFGLAILIESTASPATRFVYRLSAVVVIVAGSWSISHLFEPTTANNALLVIGMFGLGLLAVISASGRRQLAALGGPTEDTLRGFQHEVRDLQPGIAGIATLLVAEWRAFLAVLNVQTSVSLEQIEGLRHAEQRLSSETDAVNAANKGAEQQKIHPNVYNSPSFQEAKLEAEIKMKLDVFALQMELAKLRGEMDTKIDGVVTLGTRPIKEIEKYHAKLTELHELRSKLGSITDSALRQTMTEQLSQTLDAVLKDFNARFGLKPDNEAPFGPNVG